MTLPCQLYIFRHGVTDWNEEGRYQGQADVPLNERGRAQAQALIPLLAPLGLEAIVSSDLSRAWETGSIAARGLGLPIFADPGLREVHVGQAQGMLASDIERLLGRHFIEQWHGGTPSDADLRWPDGESWAQVQARAVKAVRDFHAAHPYRRIGVSTHGGVVRQLMALALPPEAPAVAVPNTVVYPLVLQSDGRLTATGEPLTAEA